MGLLSWANGDLFSTLRDKVNAIVTLLNGGLAGQILTSDGAGSSSWSYGTIISTLTLSTEYSTGWGNGTNSTILSLDASGSVEFNADIQISTGGTTTAITLPSAYRPAKNKRFIIADYNGTDGASSIMIMNINTSGVVTIFKQTDGTKPADRTELNFSINYSTIG